jgi:hypothetical protein
VPASVLAARARGGTLSCRSGAATSFVSCIRLFDGFTAPPTMSSLFSMRARLRLIMDIVHSPEST